MAAGQHTRLKLSCFQHFVFHLSPSHFTGGVIDPEATMDREEADECRKMHGIVTKYDMHDCFRWIVAQARGGAAVCWSAVAL